MSNNYDLNQVPPDERTNRVGALITCGGVITLDQVLPQFFKWLHVGSGGNLLVTAKDGSTIPFLGLLDGSWVPVLGNAVVTSATIGGVGYSTTASNITWHGGI